MKMLFSIFAILCTCVSCAFACESCGRAPGSITPPHGGLIEETPQGHVIELIRDRDQLRLYVYNHDIKPIALDGYSIQATIIPPKKSPQDLALRQNDDHYVGATDLPSNLHRYNIHVQLNIENRHEEVQFVIENYR